MKHIWRFESISFSREGRALAAAFPNYRVASKINKPLVLSMSSKSQYVHIDDFQNAKSIDIYNRLSAYIQSSDRTTTVSDFSLSHPHAYTQYSLYILSFNKIL